MFFLLKKLLKDKNIYIITVMGIKNLSKLLQKHCSQYIKRTTLNDYKGKTIGIDASIFFYKFIYVSNKYNKPNFYLQLFYQQIMGMLQRDIVPIYIFDGEAPVAKQDEHVKRKESKVSRRDKINEQKEYIEQMKKTVKNMPKDDKYKELLLEIRNKEYKVKSQEDGIVYVTEKHKKNLKALLTILSIPYVQGYGETDPLSTQLCKDGLVDFIMSEDMDYMPLGCPDLIRTERQPKGSDVFEKVYLEYKYTDMLQGLGLSSLQFIDMCILCGCDYVDQLYKIGPMTAYKLIKQHQSIEDALPHIDPIKHQIPGNYLQSVKEARKCLQKTHTHRITKDMLKLHKPNLLKLREFMNKFCSFSPGQQKYYIDILYKSPIVPINN